jgi:hypothetical protein
VNKISVCIAAFGLYALLISPVTATDTVYFIPQQSNATYCNSTSVEIWANATGFAGGRINLTYNPTCSNVTNWVKNSASFPEGGNPVYYNGGITIDFYKTGDTYTGTYMIGTLTIHCANNSQGGCETPLTFVSPSSLRDDIGNPVPATWINGTFTCGELSQCLGTCCNDSTCTDTYQFNVSCKSCLEQAGKHWKPNRDSACFNGNSTSNLCLNYCPHCCDSIDNDYDGSIDYPHDGACTCGLDPSEVDPLPPIPELPTIFLFGVGLLTLAGYVLWKKKRP